MKVTYRKDTGSGLVILEIQPQFGKEHDMINDFIEGKQPLQIRKMYPEIDTADKRVINGVYTVAMTIRGFGPKQAPDTTKYKHLSPGQLYQTLGMDGRLWAEAYCEFFPTADLDTMTGWFCSAIMAGYDEASKRAGKTTGEPLPFDASVGKTDTQCYKSEPKFPPHEQDPPEEKPAETIEDFNSRIGKHLVAIEKPLLQYAGHCWIYGKRVVFLKCPATTPWEYIKHLFRDSTLLHEAVIIKAKDLEEEGVQVSRRKANMIISFYDHYFALYEGEAAAYHGIAPSDETKYAPDKKWSTPGAGSMADMVAETLEDEKRKNITMSNEEMGEKLDELTMGIRLMIKDFMEKYPEMSNHKLTERFSTCDFQYIDRKNGGIAQTHLYLTLEINPKESYEEYERRLINKLWIT